MPTLYNLEDLHEHVPVLLTYVSSEVEEDMDDTEEVEAISADKDSGKRRRRSDKKSDKKKQRVESPKE